MSGKRAFTLVEMLLVVAVIGLLIALLLPALSRSRYHAKLALCANNLKQIAIGANAYAPDNMSYYPHRATNINGTAKPGNIWRGGGLDDRPLINRYMAINAMFNDPLTGTVNMENVYPSTTIEAWINPDSVAPGSTTAFRRIALNWGTETSYHFGIHGDDVSLFVNDGGGAREVAFGGDVVAGQWQHVAAVVDGVDGQARVYLNGVQVGTALFIDGAVLDTTTQGLGIGDSAGSPSTGFRFSGLVDEVAMWRTALTADQIRTHYLAFDQGYFNVIPEPATATLGLLGLAVLMRRRRTA